MRNLTDDHILSTISIALPTTTATSYSTHKISTVDAHATGCPLHHLVSNSNRFRWQASQPDPAGIQQQLTR